MVLAWLVLGVILLAFEMRHLAFYALFGGRRVLRRLRDRRCSCPIIPVQVAVAVVVAGARHRWPCAR